MNSKHNFRKLKIWQQSLLLVSETYKMTRTFPDIEKFNLVTQLNRCAVSIPSNIAEGSSKSSDKHFKSYLEISLGSAYEWETQINIAIMEKYITQEKFNMLENKIQNIQKMITKFKNSLI